MLHRLHRRPRGARHRRQRLGPHAVQDARRLRDLRPQGGDELQLALAKLGPEELHRFTHVDHDGREALVVTWGDDIIAVGRYDRVPGTATAEVAFVVTDAWQGRGLGTLLFHGLAQRALPHGITTFVAETLGENRRMLRVLHRLGLPLQTRFDDGVVHAEVDITSEETS